jgi:GNAT superfamily N-acetyltransferase
MSITTFFSRFAVFLKRNGLRATARRVGLAANRALFSNRMILFYCDLSEQRSPTSDWPSSLKAERHRNQTDLSPRDLEEIASFWNPKLACRNIKERFELGASLWLIKFEDKLAGYGWTLLGRTVEPHYFQLGNDDVHLFDFHVFPRYRGRGLNPLLVSYILRCLAAECHGRAFIEAAAWNQAQLASLQRTAFRRLGSAKKFTILRRTIVCWDREEAVERKHEPEQAPLASTGSKQSSIPDLRA